MLLPRYREMPIYDDQYGVPAGPRYTARPALPPPQLAKLDVFIGEI